MGQGVRRVIRGCDTCGQQDDHPRHHILQPDGTVQSRHMDCCRDSGMCVDDHCDAILTASGELRRQNLVRWIDENVTGKGDAWRRAG